MKHCLVFASLISPSKMILFEKKYQTFDTVFHHQMKYLEVRQKYSAARRIFNSLLGVSSGDETLHLMFDILLETTAESSLTSFLASGASFVGREAVRRATKSREVPCHIKIGRRTVLKVYSSGREASRKTPGSGLLSIFPGKCRTYRKCIE